MFTTKEIRKRVRFPYAYTKKLFSDSQTTSDQQTLYAIYPQKYCQQVYYLSNPRVNLNPKGKKPLLYTFCTAS